MSEKQIYERATRSQKQRNIANRRDNQFQNFSPPPIAYPPELPITGKKDEIISAIKKNPVVVITGATGSGKTTQLPKMCLEAGFGQRGMIACTQPRRIAATTVAARVAEELGADGENIVGYKIRFADHTNPATRIKFVTDGMLLAETQNDPALRAYDAIIVDEAHERSLNIDFLLGILKRLILKRKELKLIITSATIDTDKFSKAFEDAPIIEVSGRTYPIETIYKPIDPVEEDSGDVTYIDQAVEAIAELHRKRFREDALIFMPTERDILETVDALQAKKFDNIEIIPLFGRLSGQDQGRAFRPARNQKIVVATNVAETSVTVPGIRCVIDSGLARISAYNPGARTHSLPIRPISRSSADQRMGRCGRIGPGICIRLYSDDDYSSRPEFSPPEIMRSNLAEVILRMISLNLGDPTKFPFIDPPSQNAIKDGFATLRELGAINTDKKLTSEGRLMARLPLDPRVSKMILEAKKRRALREVTVIASALSVQDPRERPPDKKEQANAAHSKFKTAGSDFLTYIKIWDAYHGALEQIKSQGKMRKFCKEHFLSFNRMREWSDVHEQIMSVLKKENGFSLNKEPANEDSIHMAILSGHMRNIGFKKEKNIYHGTQNKLLTIFPGSGQVNKAGKWIVAGELVETSRLYARTIANIKEEWLEELAGALCRRSCSEPHWEKNQGHVAAFERVTLFGLTIISGRKIDFRRIDPKAAREIFIRSALVEGEIKGKYGFLEHNRELLEKLEDLESRIRRRGLIPDEDALFSFYDERIGDVCDQRTFNKALKDRGSDEFLRLKEEDLARGAVNDSELEPFPETITTGDIKISLLYQFEPGTNTDGVTALIPEQLAHRINPEIFEWLVPGLLEEKVTLLLKGLPKRIRKNLIPIAETAQNLISKLQPYNGSVFSSLQELILKDFRIRISRSDWSTASLPTHLSMNFRLIDANGKTLTTSRNYAELLNSNGSSKLSKRIAPEMGAMIDIARKEWEREIISASQLTGFPERIPMGAAGYAFPALNKKPDGKIALQLFMDKSESLKANRGGLLALYASQFANEIKVLKKDLGIDKNNRSALPGILQSNKTNQDLLDFILAELFEVKTQTTPKQKTFEEKIKQLKNGELFRKAKALFNQITEAVEERKRIKELLEKIKRLEGKNNAARIALFKAEIERLLPEDFLQTFHAKKLPDARRYLKALGIRVERAHLSPAKDAEKEARMAPHEKRLREAEKADLITAEQLCLVEEYAKMIEELRVSLFAQEVGTSFPISEKRLDRKWEEIKGIIKIENKSF